MDEHEPGTKHGVLDQISDFASKMFGGKTDAEKRTGAPNPDAIRSEGFQPGSNDYKVEDKEVRGFSYAGKTSELGNLKVEDTKFFQGNDSGQITEYAKDAQQKVRENTNELTAPQDYDADEMIRRKEDANQSHEKVQQYGWNPDKKNNADINKMADQEYRES